jgi:hypothetical protein
VGCDESIAEEGDPCGGGAACSIDGTAFLRCRDGVLQREMDCPGPRHCHHEGTRVICEHGPPIDDGLAALREHFGCASSGRSRACAALDAFASGHAPAAPAHGQSWLGVERCTQDEHSYMQLSSAPEEGAARVDATVTSGFSEEPAWSQLERALAAQAPSSSDPTVRAIFDAARQSPKIVPADEPAWTIDTARDIGLASLGGSMGVAAVREANGSLYLLERRGTAFCMAELRFMGDVEIDDLPVVSCSRQFLGASVGRTELGDCEDGHSYSLRCEDGQCTCSMDGQAQRTFPSPANAAPDQWMMRRECHYPVHP